ncbi:MAG: hypothetical protein ABFD59_11010 [Smithella sp.]
MLHATGNLHILDRRVGAGTRFGKPHGAAPFTCAQFGDELMSPLFSFKPAKHPFFVLAYDATYRPVEARNDDFFEYVKNMWGHWAHRPVPDSSSALMCPGDIFFDA